MDYLLDIGWSGDLVTDLPAFDTFFQRHGVLIQPMCTAHYDGEFFSTLFASPDVISSLKMAWDTLNPQPHRVT